MYYIISFFFSKLLLRHFLSSNLSDVGGWYIIIYWVCMYVLQFLLSQENYYSCQWYDEVTWNAYYNQNSKPKNTASLWKPLYQTYIRVPTDAQKFFLSRQQGNSKSLGKTSLTIIRLQAWAKITIFFFKKVFMLKNSYPKSRQWVIIWNSWINLKPNISV